MPMSHSDVPELKSPADAMQHPESQAPLPRCNSCIAIVTYLRAIKLGLFRLLLADVIFVYLTYNQSWSLLLVCAQFLKFSRNVVRKATGNY